MNRTLLGVLAGLLLVAAGIFWWQGRANTEVGEGPPASFASGALPDELPSGEPGGLRGAAPPEATEITREQRRFDRLDHDRDGRITRNEMLAPRAAAFRKLDVNHDNLLTFEEWAAKTADKFKAADANGDGALNRLEYATTKPKAAPKSKPACRCEKAPAAAGKKGATRPRRAPAIDESTGGDEAEPET